MRERGWFRGGVLFIDLHGYDEKPVEPAQALDAMLRAFGVPSEHIPPGTEAQAALYRSVLAGISEPVLVIADNASSEMQARVLLPGAGPHRVVITSRHTLAGLAARLMDVTVLDETAAVTLLDKALRSARPTDSRIRERPDAAVNLARSCGGLPLALQIIASLLKADPCRDVGDLAEELSATHDRLNHLRYDDGSGMDSPSVIAAFELSYRRLTEPVATLFRLMPLNPGPDFSSATAAVLAGLPLRQARQALANLAQAHLVEAAPGLGQRWRMHDLVRLYAARMADACVHAEVLEEARGRLLGYYLGRAEDADLRIRALRGAAENSVFPSSKEARTWLDTERANLAAMVGLAASSGQERAALSLCRTLAEAFHGCFDDLMATFVVFLSVALNLKDRQGEGLALGNLGLFLQEIRRSEEALGALRTAVDIFRETGYRYGEGAVLANVGLTLYGLQRLEEAISAHEDALAIFREIGNRRAEGMTLNSLGIVLRATGRFEEAMIAHQDSAAIFRNAGDPHREGAALEDLGLTLRQLGCLDEAISAHKEAASLFQNTGDRDHESRALRNLQELISQEGDSDGLPRF